MRRTPPDGSESVTGPQPAPAGLTPGQVARWADLIADGRDEFPAGLPDPDRSALADAVRRRLRERALGLVARAVAGRLAGPPHRERRSASDVDQEV